LSNVSDENLFDKINSETIETYEHYLLVFHVEPGGVDDVKQ